MENQKANNRQLNPQNLQSAKEKLRKLKVGINLNKPGLVEAQLDSIASDLNGSGVSEAISGAPTLTEVLEHLKSELLVPDKRIDQAIDAAEQLAYLIEADWYGEDPSEDEVQDAKSYAAELCDQLTPYLDSYARG